MKYYLLSCGCCFSEGSQIQFCRYDIERLGFQQEDCIDHADILMIEGGVNDRLAEKIKKIFERMSSPKYCMSIGTCANSGGVFSLQKNYAQTHAVKEILPVDVFIPGNPPRPEAIIDGLLKLRNKIQGEKT